MSTENQLVALDDISIDKAPAIYGHNKLTAYVALAREQAANEVPDLATKKGRDRIASLAAQVSRSKTAVEKPGREYLKRIKEMPKAIEAELREFVNSMDALRDEVRAPLNEWEQAEADRVARHEERVQQLRDFAVCDNLQAAGIRVQIENLEEIAVDASFEEYEAEAHRVKNTALVMLRTALVKREQYEAEQAELERLRAEAAQREQKEREERIAREAAERARLEAEQSAQAERLQFALAAEQSARRELEAQQRAEQAERDAAERAERAAAAERQRQADEQARIEREAKAREADIAHKTAVLTSIKEAFMAAGITEDQAKAVINMIRKGEVPSVSITY